MFAVVKVIWVSELLDEGYRGGYQAAPPGSKKIKDILFTCPPTSSLITPHNIDTAHSKQRTTVYDVRSAWFSVTLCSALCAVRGAICSYFVQQT